jgi:hypothetical protein
MDEDFAEARMAHINSVSHEPVLPPVTFDYYGLPPSWNGLRWLDVVNGDWAALWLGHLSSDFASGLLVGTLPRSIFDVWSARSGVRRDNTTAALSLACQRFAEIVSPDRGVTGPTGARTKNHRHAEQQAEGYINWPLNSWNVNGEVMDAHVWTFAGAWVGLCEDLPDAHLIAVGVGLPPEDLKLDTVQNSAMYGVDLTKPLTAAAMRGQRTHEMTMPHPNQNSWHPEQLALLDN